jgi:hypothetical protein
MTNEFVEFLLNLAVGYVAFRVVLALLERYLLFRILKTVHKELGQVNTAQEEIVPDNIMTLNVERVGDQYLCYDELTNDFVCQGKNIPELTASFKVMYPDMQAALASEDEATIVALSKEPEVKKVL